MKKIVSATAKDWSGRLIIALLVTTIVLLPATLISSNAAEEYDIVILNGRVIDPETKLDAIRNVGITRDKIQILNTKSLKGKTIIDAKGLVVSPGFIDLHWHGRMVESYRYEAMDGVTSSFELEVGTADVDRWYAERAGKALINYGVSIGHIPVRMAVMRDPGDFLPSGDAATRAATETELAEIKQRIENGLKRGAVAVGFGTGYTPAASHWEILEMFRVAARHRASCHVHMNSRGGIPVERLEQVIAASAISGAPLHVVHINSSSGASIAQTLQMIAEARSHGLDVTTECYPYTAGATRIESALFDGWENQPDSYFQNMQWVATGERLNRESFARYRKTGGTVIMHGNTEERVLTAVSSPLTMIASDGFDVQKGQGHPRSAGTYSKILGRYVREKQALSLMEALRKMTIMPAQRLEGRVPVMKNKGRLRVGGDADITIFDAEQIIDRSTYEDPAQYSAGVKFVLVKGALVVKDGRLQDGVSPGSPIRAPMQ
jgi:N-acyl-D-aspartate/D-glutamate deacylase